ncbi:MAG: ecotin [Cyanobacteria bacterium K_DeepCast_35m_m2_155]|nr:ecotin [Cyanobacteria bacterium K_DeepCast_35m_m2_155]
MLRRSLAVLIGSATALLIGAPAATAIPRLDLSAYPAPATGERRWVIQLPGVLPAGADPELSRDPRDWRVQLIVAQMATVDCNLTSFAARLRPWRTSEASPMVFRVDRVGPLFSTRRACPPDQKPRKALVTMAGKPYVVPYNASRPIVVYAPAELELRWRLWKAETQSREALAQ